LKYVELVSNREEVIILVLLLLLTARHDGPTAKQPVVKAVLA